MTDEIIKVDCQGEGPEFVERAEIARQMTPEEAAKIPIKIELGEHGLYYGTSPQMKGLLVTGKSMKEVSGRMPFAIAEMRAVAAMGPEITRLREQLTEAREIIAALIEGSEEDDQDLREVLAPHFGTEPGNIDVTHPAVRRARAFLTKGETDDA